MTEMKAWSRILIFLVFIQCTRSQWRNYNQYLSYNKNQGELQNVTSAPVLTKMLESTGSSFYDNYYGNKYLNTFTIISCLNSTIEKVPSLLFQKFTALENFAAVGVQLQEINRDDLKYASSLKILDLSYNNVARLENMLFLNPQALQKIDLSNNQISWIHDNVFEGISKKLTRIDLSFNKLVTLKEESFMLFDSTSPLEINLKSNKLEEITTSTQTNEMKKPWINLSLSNNSLKSINFSYVKVWNIDLDNNAIESLTLNNAVNELRAKNNKLNEIHIGSRTKLVNAENNKIAMVKLEISSNLETLRLSGNKVGSEILQELKMARGLVTLDLSDTSLATLSADSFSEFENLTQLNLDMNSISSIDYGVFAHQKNLKRLNISHNILLAIDFHVLATLSSLEILDISGNKLSQINDYASLNKILPKLSNVGLEGNSWNCEYLSKLRISLQSQNISIIKAIRPIKESSSIAGIACVANASESVSLINIDQNNEVVEKINQLAEKFNQINARVNDIDSNKTDLRSLIFGLQKDILSMKTENLANQISTTNATNINEVRLLVEQMNNNTLERQKLAIDQLTQKINEQNVEIARHKLDSEKLMLSIKSSPNDVSPQPQQFMNEKVSGFSSTEIWFAIVLTALVMLVVMFGAIKAKNFIVNVQQTPRRRSRHSSMNTIATFDNSSV